MTPNRIAVALTAVAGLLGALAPAVADLDWTSTAGLIAGLLTILSVVNKWLEGWQKHEARAAEPARPSWQAHVGTGTSGSTTWNITGDTQALSRAIAAEGKTAADDGQTEPGDLETDVRFISEDVCPAPPPDVGDSGQPDPIQED